MTLTLRFDTAETARLALAYLADAPHTMLCEVYSHYRPMLYIPRRHKHQHAAMLAKLRASAPTCTCGLAILQHACAMPRETAAEPI